MSVWVVVVAAGSGSRFGPGSGVAKQFELLGDKRVVDWSLEVIRSVVDGVVVVSPLELHNTFAVDAVAVGGETRSASVRAGLSKVPEEAEVILVHDAARPFASKELYRAVLDAVLSGADAAIPGVPVVDTIKRVGTDHHVVETVDRSELVAVQTPQAFKAEALRRAHAANPHATDDATVIEAIGGTVVVVPGESNNFKITVANDLVFARALIDQ